MIIKNDIITEASLGVAVTDANAQAYINSAISKGANLSPLEVSSINKLFIELKSLGVYESLDAFWPLMGSSPDTHMINAKLDTTYDLIYSGYWVHTNDGQKGNGSDTMALTNWKITEANRYNYSFGVYLNDISNVGTTTDMGVGINEIGSYWFLAQYWDSYGSIYYSGDLNFNYATASSGTSFLMSSRTSASDYKGFNNGVMQLNDTSGVSSATSSQYSIALGARNIEGVASIPSSNNEIFAFVGDGLTLQKANDLFTCVNAFLISIGRI